MARDPDIQDWRPTEISRVTRDKNAIEITRKMRDRFGEGRMEHCMTK
jgi:hypothetical protein